jgi:hypothetical protein
MSIKKQKQNYGKFIIFANLFCENMNNNALAMPKQCPDNALAMPEEYPVDEKY